MWVLSVVIVVMLIADVAKVIYHDAAGYYAFQPGTAPVITTDASCRGPAAGNLALPNGTPCVRLVVPAGQGHQLSGSLYMVDVLLGPAPVGYFLLSKLHLLSTFAAGVQLVPKSAVLGTTPPSQLGCQDAQQMSGATSSAAVVALRRLGYSVRENDLGAQLTQIVPHSAASAAGLQCNDTVTAVNSTPIHTDSDLVNTIHSDKPGQVVAITAQRVNQSGHSQNVVLHPRLTGTPAGPGQPAQPGRAFLGVASTTLVTFTMPFNVTIDVGNIGGPSAGLALTLGLLDVLSNGDLTGGHRVAATGTINLDGTVGDVGGVAQKAVAVRRAGAQLFLVPPQELKAAQSNAGSMKVMAVSTLQQALADLQALGGHLPATTSGHNGGG